MAVLPDQLSGIHSGVLCRPSYLHGLFNSFQMYFNSKGVQNLIDFIFPHRRTAAPGHSLKFCFVKVCYLLIYLTGVSKAQVNNSLLDDVVFLFSCIGSSVLRPCKNIKPNRIIYLLYVSFIDHLSPVFI